MHGEVDSPIGMFDSGFGGLTVARAVIDLLPNEDIVYIGDTARYPYGNKSSDAVRSYAFELAKSLVEDFHVKMIVVACNTAASVALDQLREVMPVPVIGVVEPGARALVRITNNKKVGVIGTVGTISSGAYDRAISETNVLVELVTAACPGFVEFVERDQTTGEEVLAIAEKLLAPLRESGLDSLLLGCTHYPYLADVIGQVMGPNVKLVSSADETAVVVRDALIANNNERITPSNVGGVHDFYSSGDVKHFAELGRRLLGPELENAKYWQASNLDSNLKEEK